MIHSASTSKCASWNSFNGLLKRTQAAQKVQSRQHRSSTTAQALKEEDSVDNGRKSEASLATAAGRTRVPSRKVSSPNNVAMLPGRAAPAGAPYHQGTSQYKGVSWSDRSKKWRAQLWHGHKVCTSAVHLVCQLSLA
jgi:hypothetical protein